MRLLGVQRRLTVFRWDLVYLFANLEADERAEIATLAAPIGARIQELRAEREALELAEDAALVSAARRNRRDESLDTMLIEMGGVVRAKDKPLYASLFPKRNPSKTARLPLAEEVQEVTRILGELSALTEEHPVHAAYHAPLTAANAALKTAMQNEDQADTALALARSRVVRFKLALDQARVAVHGQLLTLLKDKAAADAFFRSSTKRPGDEEEEEGEEEEGSDSDDEETTDGSEASPGTKPEGPVKAGAKAKGDTAARTDAVAKTDAMARADVKAKGHAAPKADAKPKVSAQADAEAAPAGD